MSCRRFLSHSPRAVVVCSVIGGLIGSVIAPKYNTNRRRTNATRRFADNQHRHPRIMGRGISGALVVGLAVGLSVSSGSRLIQSSNTSTRRQLRAIIRTIRHVFNSFGSSQRSPVIFTLRHDSASSCRHRWWNRQSPTAEEFKERNQRKAYWVS